MSGPGPAPSMKAAIGWWGTCSWRGEIVIFSPAGIFTRAAAMRLLLAEKLSERVQGGARLEPADLLVGHGVEALDRDRLASRLVDHHLHRLARGQPGQPFDADPVRLLEQVVVRRLGERERQDPLLLEVRLVDAGEALDDHDLAAEVPRRHGRMLAARSPAVVLLAHHDPAHPARLQVPRDLGEGLARPPRNRVLALARLPLPRA